jgi:hypothetical protein
MNHKKAPAKNRAIYLYICDICKIGTAYDISTDDNYIPYLRCKERHYFCKSCYKFGIINRQKCIDNCPICNKKIIDDIKLIDFILDLYTVEREIIEEEFRRDEQKLIDNQLELKVLEPDNYYCDDNIKNNCEIAFICPICKLYRVDYCWDNNESPILCYQNHLFCMECYKKFNSPSDAPWDKESKIDYSKCPICTKQAITDKDLLAFLLKKFKLNRSKVENDYRKSL